MITYKILLALSVLIILFLDIPAPTLPENAWYAQKLNLHEIHKHNRGAGVVVAIIDTGVDYTHKFLRDNILINYGEIPEDGIDNDNNGYIDDYYGVDLVDKSEASCTDKDCNQIDGDPMDYEGHGTHLAGIIHTVAPDAKIIPIRMGWGTKRGGHVHVAQFCNALDYAQKRGAHIVNLSWGSAQGSDLITKCLDKYPGLVYVAAAGNSSREDELVMPGTYQHVISVAANTPDDKKAPFSNFGKVYSLYLPGVWIWSSLPGDKYGYESGTSMASPIMAGLLALQLSKDGRIDETKLIDDKQQVITSPLLETGLTKIFFHKVRYLQSQLSKSVIQLYALLQDRLTLLVQHKPSA